DPAGFGDAGVVRAILLLSPAVGGPRGARTSAGHARHARLARMPPIVPTGPATARSLTAVAPEMLRSLEGASDLLRPARSAVLFAIDGLGALQLRAHAGHARRLSALGGKKDVARSVFPSTTAAALTSLLTGADPGEHGLVGYRVMDPDQGRLANQLNGYEKDG